MRILRRLGLMTIVGARRAVPLHILVLAAAVCAAAETATTPPPSLGVGHAGIRGGTADQAAPIARFRDDPEKLAVWNRAKDATWPAKSPSPEGGKPAVA